MKYIANLFLLNLLVYSDFQLNEQRYFHFDILKMSFHPVLWFDDLKYWFRIVLFPKGQNFDNKNSSTDSINKIQMNPGHSINWLSHYLPLPTELRYLTSNLKAYFTTFIIAIIWNVFDNKFYIFFYFTWNQL